MKQTILLIVILIATAISVAAECSDTDKKALAALDAAWSTAGQNGDKAALMKIYADDYMGLPGMQGKSAAIEATMGTFEKNKANPSGANKVTADHYIISCTPVSATVTHRNTVWAPNGAGGKPETYYSRSVHIFEKRNGNWQVVSNAGNDLDDYGILWYLEQDWNNALWKKDRSWFEKNYASDFTSISSSTAKIMSRAEDISDTVDDKGMLDLVETTGMNIRIDGNYAVITGTFRMKGKDEKGTGFDRTVRYTDTWIRRDGRWQAWSSQGTPLPAAPQVAKN